MKEKVEICPSEEDVFYVIFFIHAQSKNIIFLDASADIESICYASNPTLAGTINYELAKRYNSIEEAKNDIYKLRYHHREFLKIATGIKSISVYDVKLNKIPNSETALYKLVDLS